ncbi:MAG: hypothetical protein WCO69_02505 [Candidatus Omnitrophota bacterium]
MKISGFLKVMFVVTTMGVLYIHLQMSIYDLAYQGKRKEDRIEKLAENNVMMKNDILRLKSSDHIGRQLLVNEKDYKFLGRNNVVEVEATGSNPVLGLLAFAKF